jgi:hypothetical protein
MKTKTAADSAELSRLRAELREELRSEMDVKFREQATAFETRLSSIRPDSIFRHSGRDGRFTESMATEAVGQASGEIHSITDRRGMLKKVVGLAAGVAAAGLLKPSAARADNGNPLLFGATTTGTLGNSETSPARFAYNGAATSAALFVFEDGTTLLPSDSGYAAVLAGWASGSGGAGSNVGVFGFSGASVGRGVVGGASALDGIGVLGIGGNGGSGVDGSTDGASTSSSGVNGTALHGTGGTFAGGRAALFLSPGAGAVADPNAGIPGSVTGDVYRGSTNGSVWYKAGGPKPYRRLADSTTAGALTAFASTSIFVDTIAGSGNTYQGQTIGANQVKTYQIGGVTAGGNSVPLLARAVIGRIANPNSNANGVILVAASNPPLGSNGVLAVKPGAPENSFFLSALDATGKLYVKGAFASGTTDLLILISGFYL